MGGRGSSRSVGFSVRNLGPGNQAGGQSGGHPVAGKKVPSTQLGFRTHAGEESVREALEAKLSLRY